MTSLYDLTSPDVRELIDDRPIAVLPFGSIEQHGPHLPCGTDTMAADLVAIELARRIGGLHAPFCPYGVTPIHAGHPGTVTLRRQTFEALLTDVCKELIAMGTKTLIFVNWHEINTPSLDAVATDLQEETGTRVFVAQACYVAQRIYADDGGSLTHGGSIETMAVMAYDPSLLKLERAGKPSRPPGAEAKDAMRRSKEVYGFVTDVSEIAAEGWYGDPAWATPERAATFPSAVVDDIAKQLDAIEALEGAAMIIDREALRFETRPGRKSADPLADAGLDFTVRIVCLSSKSVRWAHRHPKSVELLHVTEGRGVLWEEGVQRRFERGDTALVPAGVPHATLPDPGTAMELICFFPHPDLDNNIEELEDMIVSAGQERAANG